MINQGLPEEILPRFSSFISRRGLYLILASAAIVFINSLNNNFVWDDRVLMVPNDVYRTFDIKRIFLSTANALEYLPFRDLTLAVDYWLWGSNPFGYHLSNLLFYLVSLAALYKMVGILVDLADVKQGEMIPFWTTLIFALHPLHVEAVNFIGARNNILAGLFLFLSFNFCISGLKRGKNAFIVFSALFFIIALFSKASVVFYPLFLAAVLYFMPDTGVSKRKKILIFLLFCMLDAIAIRVHLDIASSTSVISDTLPRYGVYSTPVIIGRALQIPFFYLKMLVFPYPLSIKYAVSFITGGMVLFLGMGVLYILVILYVIRASKKRNILPVLAVIWYFLSLGPVLNIFPTSPTVADRYAYFAVLSLGLLTASLVREITSGRKVFIFAVFAMVTAWGAVDVSRSMDWKSDISLWESALRVNPEAGKSELAIALWNEGQHEESLAYFKEERDRTGSYEYSLYKGRKLFLSGQSKEAVIFYKQALAEGAGALKEAHLYIAQAYEKTGSDRLAMKYYLKVFDTRSQDPLGEYRQQAEDGLNRIRSRYSAQLAELQSRALKEPMNFQVQSSTALFLYNMGMYSEAEKYYLKSLELIPERRDLWYKLGVIYMKLSRYDEAIDLYKRLLALKPEDTEVLANIGISYMAGKDYEQAAGYFKLALKSDPDFLYAAFNLGKIYLITGDKKESRKYFLKARELAGGNNALVKSIEQLLKKVS